MTSVNALQGYQKAIKIVSDFPFLVRVSETDEHLREAQAAVLDAFHKRTICPPAGKIFVRCTGESLLFRPANPGVVHVSAASLRVGSLCDCIVGAEQHI